MIFGSKKKNESKVHFQVIEIKINYEMSQINKLWILMILTNWTQSENINDCKKSNLPLPLNTEDSRIKYDEVQRNKVYQIIMNFNSRFERKKCDLKFNLNLGSAKNYAILLYVYLLYKK